MVVTDSCLFPPSIMKVRFTNMHGVDHILELHQDLTVDKAKIKCLDYFHNSAESMKMSLYHKLVLVRNGKVLTEGLSLQQEGVRDNDEILLLKKRIQPSPYEASDKQSRDDRKGPDMETIKRATANIPKSAVEAVQEDATLNVDFQTELRRILISLIDASQRILCLNPEASKVFKQAEDILNEPSKKPKVDTATLKQLTDMGFPGNRARKALILNKMSVMSAMEWLLQHQNDADIDEDVPEPDTDQPPPEEEGAVGGIESASGESPKVTNIRQSLKAFRKREFRPNPRALQKLLEMGFEEQEAGDALRVARNDQDAACEWLLGDRKMRPETIDEGLDTNSPIYQAIIANPTVQLGLNNPRCLLAFLQMLENPVAASQWLNDPETGPILMQISKIYHAEKNSKPQLTSLSVHKSR
ncbi:ubiquitin-associated domain-containing protein 1 [Patella vulgata]|uniref:ubiquitin-associated domain-containing protein 1 n=1 Tax=Patella vulgata TaxID=6465 RepID=UPI0021809A6A|nr:ubiquitin-associated domain-containing protein 1 [Patella vulgata]